ncbi:MULTISPECIES: TadE/TadG family type IV pilus assembly protein [unclassified Streptomyces]|uniref:TadE/TadG family type IV pilus assembly protein n=1 Tax=unclassified Streptomyces TaxID=2593676 RepID=UPI002255790A|nr:MULTISPECIES: TadE/TadG family type IV pilus assembly protein [unclassified Streptomyces]MCX5060653.1 pilus assembly protein [Streptomyces sp. NBC_00452]MCX5293756.1 pilus assembly protein [Streptomyces sp. NBC_00183]
MTLSALRDLLHSRMPRDDRGLSAIEVVILAPVMILFILVLVAFGQMVDGRGAIDGAARDAARSGSLQWDQGNAMAEARKAAEADLSDVCSGPVTVTKTSLGFANADLFTVDVSCEIRGLAMLGLDIQTRMSGSFTAPLDPYKRKA